MCQFAPTKRVRITEEYSAEADQDFIQIKTDGEEKSIAPRIAQLEEMALALASQAHAAVEVIELRQSYFRIG